MSESKTSYGGRLSLSMKPVFCPDFFRGRNIYNNEIHVRKEIDSM